MTPEDHKKFKNWLNQLDTLEEDRTKLLAFEKNAVALIEKTFETLNKDLQMLLTKEVQESDWTPYLDDDFNILSWSAGDFHQHIFDWLSSEIDNLLEKDRSASRSNGKKGD